MAFAKLYHSKNSKNQVFYYVRYYLPGQSSKNERRFTIGTVSNRRAKEICERIRAMVIQGVDPNDFYEEQTEKTAGKKRWKLAEVVEAYLQHSSIANRPKTLQIKEYAFKLLLQYIGNCYFDKITREMIESWMTSMNISKTSANMYFRTVRAMFNWAFEEEIIAVNPFANGRIKQYKLAHTNPEGYFTIEEVRIIRETINEMDSELGRLVFLALETGGRISELLSLRKDDIDLKSARILFRGISTKSGRNRYVPLRPQAVQEIREWKVYPDGKMFRWTDFKKPSKRFTQALKNLGLYETSSSKRTFHTLRHTYASLLLMAGVNIFIVSRWLGHSSVTVTDNHYGHLIPEMLEVPLPKW